jgi:hypothetical protein
MSSYSEKLKSPKWQKKRLKIFERDSWKCRFCQSEERTLHVHHTEYIPGLDPWEYDDNLLLTLCEMCHNSDHLMNGALTKFILPQEVTEYDMGFLDNYTLEDMISNPEEFGGNVVEMAKSVLGKRMRNERR